MPHPHFNPFRRQIGRHVRINLRTKAQQHVGSFPVRCGLKTGQFHLTPIRNPAGVIANAIFPSLGITG
jgi:hypothetical protein